MAPNGTQTELSNVYCDVASISSCSYWCSTPANFTCDDCANNVKGVVRAGCSKYQPTTAGAVVRCYYEPWNSWFSSENCDVGNCLIQSIGGNNQMYCGTYKKSFAWILILSGVGVALLLLVLMGIWWAKRRPPATYDVIQTSENVNG